MPSKHTTAGSARAAKNTPNHALPHILPDKHTTDMQIQCNTCALSHVTFILTYSFALPSLNHTHALLLLVSLSLSHTRKPSFIHALSRMFLIHTLSRTRAYSLTYTRTHIHKTTCTFPRKPSGTWWRCCQSRMPYRISHYIFPSQIILIPF